MAILPIVTYNDPILRTQTEEVKTFDQSITQLVEDMFETMYNADGVGLAAPQIGRTERIFVIDPDPISEEIDQKTWEKMAFINPKITRTWGDSYAYREGCLSLPELFEEVQRPSHIEIEYLDENFQKQVMEADGFLSRVIQHEFDHLEGVLFVDYLSRFKKRLIAKRLKKIETGKQEAAYPLVPKSKG
jgi:peptide deformylase